MAIPEVPLSCCCDWGTGRIGRVALGEWFLVGLTTNLSYDLLQSDGTVILDNQLGFGSPLLTDDQSSLYSLFSTSGGPSAAFPTFRKYDNTQTQVWSLTDSNTDTVRNSSILTSVAPISSTPFHFDIDGDFNFYYCGRSDESVDVNTEGRLVKLDSTGVQDWLATAHETFSGASISAYRFCSCSVDLNGNVCAVGARFKYTGSGPAVLIKKDWIVYMFDSAGSELWRDDVADDTTLNADNLHIIAVQCCFDDEGNVYVGFAKVEGSATGFPVIRKYDPDGAIVWTKTLTNSQSTVFALGISPAGKLIALTAVFGGSVVLRQWSDSSHSTLDWSFTVTPDGGVCDMSIDQEGNIYVTNGTPSGSGVHWRRVNGSTGLEMTSGSDITSATRPIAKPGKHPHFI